jgi:hypothetical protein
LHLAAFTAKQRQAQLLLQRLDLATDCALGQGEFQRSVGVAFMSGGGFKGQQQRHRGGEVTVIHS